MNKITYPVECHVCGKRWEIFASFMSSPLAVVGEDGVTRSYHSCGAHPREEVRAAYCRLTGQTVEQLEGRR